MAIGFKVADGYVEVHAHYDKGDLQRAARQAADDQDKEFNKEHVRNAKSGDTRNANREAGKQAARDHDAGFNKERERDASSGETRDTNRRIGQQAAKDFGDGWQRDRRAKITTHIVEDIERDRSFKTRLHNALNKVFRSGGGTSASAFGRGFIESVTFGQADIGPGVASKLKPQFAAAGSAVGAVFAGLFVAEVAAAITAVTPLLLGGLLAAIPMISLIKSGVKKEDGKWVFQANAMGDALKKLSGAWKEFKAVVSAPFQAPLITILDHAGDSLKRLQGPWAALVKSISPGMVALFDGVFGAIESFVTAIAPAMPGVNAGLETWGRELPKIGKALGEFFTRLMKDPDKVADSVRNISRLIQDLVRFLGFLIPILTTVGNAWSKWGNAFRLGGMAAAAVLPIIRKIATFFREVFTRDIPAALASLKQRWSEAVAGVKGFVAKVVTFLKELPGKAANAVGGFGDKVAAKIKAGQDKATAKAKELVNKVVTFLKGLPGKAASAVSSFWSKMSGAFTRAEVGARGKATDLVNRVVSFLKGLPGKAASAVHSLWPRMSGSFTSMINNAVAKGRSMVSRFISAITSLPSKAAAVARRVKGAVQGALSGAGSWLVSAGRSIMQGLANGISAGYNAVVGAIRRVASAAVAAAKSALKIGSPSKVFADEVGVPVAQGIGMGAEKQMPKEFKRIRGLVPRSVTGASEGGGSDGRSYHTTSNWNPTIHVHVQAGLETVNSAAKRALTKDIFLALEQYRKDYVDR